ncbi:MAG: glycoside hydrolase family 15 protein [Acidilobus sp.]
MKLSRKMLVIALVFLLFAPLVPRSFSFWAGKSSFYPSFLLLSNWVNDSALVLTGVPVVNATINGLRNVPFSLTNIYLGPYGVLPLNLTFDGPFSSFASLNLNNTIVAAGSYGRLEVIAPPYTPYILVLASLTAPYNFTVHTSGAVTLGKEVTIINLSVPVEVCSNDSMARVGNGVLIRGVSGASYVLISLGNRCPDNVRYLISLNDERIDGWLSMSRQPPSLPPELAKEYFLSLLVLKDDQNPYIGTFAAAPSPVYLYAWVRDSSFAAMALQAAGHYASALKYWLWMSRAARYGEAWYTRYDFYTGAPDVSYATPEYDSLGLFEIGVYYYYVFTHNITFLNAISGALNETVSFQVSSILSSSVHMIPQDLSVWEYRLAYHFWTEALNLIGIRDSITLLGTSGYNISEAEEAEMILNQSIVKYFWNGSAFYSALVPFVVFTPTGRSVSPQPEAPYVSSSSILPLAFGYGMFPASLASSDVRLAVSSLMDEKVGGLVRFVGDTYHYENYLYDSSGPNPPWIVTTLFLAYYYALDGNVTGTEGLLTWAVSHSQEGLLPEAIDPNYGNPLPTTSPLTWSSAMYVLATQALSRRSGGGNRLMLAFVVIAIVVAVTFALQRIWVSRLRRVESGL